MDKNKERDKSTDTITVSEKDGMIHAADTACLNIVEEYKKSLWVGAADVDTTLAEMTKRLKAAGMDDLIQAKQEQLDAWMSSK